MGNTVVVVEHDEDTMRAADHVIDFGPGPGVRGGAVVAAGTVADVMAVPESVTGRYLAGDLRIEIPPQRRPIGARQAVYPRRCRTITSNRSTSRFRSARSSALPASPDPARVRW